MFHETFLTSTFQDDNLLNKSTLRPDDLRSLNVQYRRSTQERRTYHVIIDIQAIHHEKPTLEAREVTKLHRRDSTSSNDDFTSYTQSIKLISTPSTTHPANNETPDLYLEKATLSTFIYEGRSTTTKPTFVALPYLTSHSTFHKCSRGTPCQPQASPHIKLTKLVVNIPIPYAWKEGSHYCRHSLLAGTPQRNTHRRSRFTQTQRIQRPSKFVSTLPVPLPNQRKSYLYRILCLR